MTGRLNERAHPSRRRGSLSTPEYGHVVPHAQGGDHTKTYVCTHVFDAQRPVLYVTRPDGDWCFLCGGDDHPDDAAAFRVVGLGHVVERDPSLGEILDLAPNEEAERATLSATWVRSRF